MANILFSVFSGQASAIFDDFLVDVHRRYISKKAGNVEQLPNVYGIETQWDSGGHTGYLIEFYEWLSKLPEFQKEVWKGFLLPPPMGDLKSQISRWAKSLLPEQYKIQVSALIGSKHTDLELAIQSLHLLISYLQKISPTIFTDELKMNFLSTFINSYKEFVNSNEKESSHSVGNLFLSFLYFYSYLIRENIDLVHDHHHQIFFNFLKDLSLVPRGSRYEFLIDGRYNLTGRSFEGEVISSEREFDDYPETDAVIPSTYSIDAVDNTDLDNKFEDLVNISDLIVIPPGSLSNWMPLINKFHHFMVNKPVIWIINSFHHDSEVDLRRQIEYVQSLGISPLILAPNVDSPFENMREIDSDRFHRKYQEERKHAEDFLITFEGLTDAKVIRCIPLKELQVHEGGIKYNPAFIQNFLSRLSCEIDRMVDTSPELVYVRAEELAAQLTKEFSFIKVK